MKKLQILALTMIFVAGFTDFLQATKCLPGWRANKNGVCHMKSPEQRRNIDQKKDDQKRSAMIQQAMTDLKPMQSGPIPELKGQALIDALHDRNSKLRFIIDQHSKTIQDINKSVGRTTVMRKGKLVKKQKPLSRKQKHEIHNRNVQIVKARQELGKNTVLLTKTQQELLQSTAEQSQDSLIAVLQNNGQNNGQISAAAQAAIERALTAAYNQGQADQYALDATGLTTAYNQGYIDGQAVGQNDVVNFDPASSANGASCENGSAPIMICEDGNPIGANNVCSDGSPAMLVCDSGSNSAMAQSSCDDGSIAACVDGTDISQLACGDGSAPDANGMCADGSSILCDDGSWPLCANASMPIPAAI